MAKQGSRKIMLGVTLATLAGLALLDYNLDYHHFSAGESNLRRRLETATATITDRSYKEEATFLRTCTSTTICAAIEKLEQGFKEACQLSPNPPSDLLLEWIKRERDTLFNKDGSYLVCEEWNCNEIKNCNHNYSYTEYLGQINSILPCEPLFTYEKWKRRRELERLEEWNRIKEP